MTNDYIYHISFDRPEMTNEIMAEMPDIDEYNRYIKTDSTSKSNYNYHNVFKILTHEQHIHLFRKMNYCKYIASKTQNQDMLQLALKIGNLIISANYRLILHVAKRYRNQIEYDDAVSEGHMALIKAVSKFDFSLGYRFSTYAMTSLFRAIHFYNRKHKNRPEIQPYRKDFDIKAPEIVEPINIDIKTIMRLVSPIQRIVLEYRYGLMKLPKKTGKASYRAIGEHLGVSRETIRKIEHTAYDFLRKTLSEI